MPDLLAVRAEGAATLSMIGMGYGKWLKKSAPLWTGIILLTAGLLALAAALDPIR